MYELTVITLNAIGCAEPWGPQGTKAPAAPAAGMCMETLNSKRSRYHLTVPLSAVLLGRETKMQYIHTNTRTNLLTGTMKRKHADPRPNRLQMNQAQTYTDTGCDAHEE